MKKVRFIHRLQITGTVRTTYSDILDKAIDREITLGHIADVTDENRKTLIDLGLMKLERILATGLKICKRPDGQPYCFLASRYDHLSPTYLAAEFQNDIEAEIYNAYYDFLSDDSITDLPTNADGAWHFAVKDPRAIGLKDGGIAMYHGLSWEDKGKEFDAFSARYSSAGTISPIDHVSFGLILAHDSLQENWKTEAIGSRGALAFISLPTETTNHDGSSRTVYPFGKSTNPEETVKASWWILEENDNDVNDIGVIAIVG